MPSRDFTRAIRAAIVVSSLPLSLTAQEHRARFDVAGQAVLVHRHHDPVPGGRSLAELRLVHPIVRLGVQLARGRLVVHAMANLEGATIPNGELTLGAWGEGFVDRRHPHTYLHELVVTAREDLGPVRGSLSAGKGFVPFGTDDPMTRPPLGYPVNHHLSQVLERAVVIAGLGAGPVVLEGALFNGDEPDAPDAWPRLDRFGDSWAIRVTVFPAAGWEGQVSHADVRSPEHRAGAGLDHTKWSASVRWAGPHAHALAEWARTSEGGGFFVFRSALVEAGLALGQHRPYARLEQTERPEEERVADFRSRRPLRDNAILGITRWSLATLGFRHRLNGSRGLILEPFTEGTFGRAANVGGGVFDPVVYYGGRSFAAVALGLRISRGMENHRMGRYGVAAPDTHEH